MKKQLILFGIAVLTLAACKKEEGCKDPAATNYNADADVDDGSCVYPEDPDPEIDFHAPAAHAQYNLGDTVFIDAHVMHDETMHGYNVYLHNTTTTDTVLNYHIHGHDTHYHIDTFWVNNVSVMSDMRLEIRVHLDHSGTSFFSNDVHFHCHNM